MATLNYSIFWILIVTGLDVPIFRIFTVCPDGIASGSSQTAKSLNFFVSNVLLYSQTI